MSLNSESRRERVEIFNMRAAASSLEKPLKENHDSPRIKALVKKRAAEYEEALEKFKSKK